MAFAPSRHGWARRGGPVKSGQLDPTELVEIRKLYVEKRYKQCIAACKEHLQEEGEGDQEKEQLHPVHKAFLLFQQAVSYEAMGLAAHKYSRNKIPFLESAEENFMSILEILEPVNNAFHRDNGSHNDDDKITPTLLTEEVFDDRAFSDSSSVYSSNSDQTIEAGNYYSSSQVNRFSQLGRGIPRTVTVKFTEIDIDKQDTDLGGSYTNSHVRHEPAPAHDADTDADTDTDADADADADAGVRQYLSRLAASLSSTHLLADNLVPQPLFKNSAKQQQQQQQQQELQKTMTRTRTVKFSDHTDIAETEPVSPLHHTFQTPNASTGVSLQLPHRLQEPQTPLSCYTDISLAPSTTSTTLPDPFTTPVTPRFAMIQSIFSRPQPQPQPHLHLPVFSHPSSSSSSFFLVSPLPAPPSPAYSLALSCYKNSLSAFLAAVRTAVSTTSSTIISSQKVQEEHAAAKRRAFIASNRTANNKRMASFWLLDDMPPTATTATTTNTPSKPSKGVDGEEDEDDATKKQKQERIEKLRASGWKVNKEKFGFKGMQYYDMLIREADVEMRMGVGKMGLKT